MNVSVKIPLRYKERRKKGRTCTVITVEETIMTPGEGGIPHLVIRRRMSGC